MGDLLQRSRCPTSQVHNATIIPFAAIVYVLASLVHSKHDLATTEYNIVVISTVLVVLTGGQMQAGLAVALLLGAFDFVSKYATGVLARMPRLKLSTSSWAILLGNLEQCSSATMKPLLLLTLVILPLMKLVETYLLKRLIGQSSESVILSLMTFSSMFSIVAETEDNAGKCSWT